jgi:hypothetical protein
MCSRVGNRSALSSYGLWKVWALPMAWQPSLCLERGVAQALPSLAGGLFSFSAGGLISFSSGGRRDNRSQRVQPHLERRNQGLQRGDLLDERLALVVGVRLGVAARVHTNLKKQRFETKISHFSFKGWVTKPGALSSAMGKLDSSCAWGTLRANSQNTPHLALPADGERGHARALLRSVRGLERERRGVRGVALQVEFERQILIPAFHFIGYRLWV